MRFTIVTISYNQVDFVEKTIHSVLTQGDVDVEYIVVDPGSTDGSRDVIQKYRWGIAHAVFDADRGPADGLNKGFALATGEIYGYLNSDDTLAPDALGKVAQFFSRNPDVDVVCGHGWVIDAMDRKLRRVWSQPFKKLFVAYGESLQIQPSTFIRSSAFRKISGFNVHNVSNWDGELLIDLYLSGARIAVINEYLSNYRLHSISITNSGSLDNKIKIWDNRRFNRLMKRPYAQGDKIIRYILKVARIIMFPVEFIERLHKGPVYKRGA